VIEHELVKQWAESAPCDEEGCAEQGIPCWLPDEMDGEPGAYYCSKHAFENGYCKWCGRFFGGIEHFDFGQGYCDDCQSEIDNDDCVDDGDELDGFYSPEDAY
jgi:hypothetical protein